jgi:ribosomal protein S4E
MCAVFCASSRADVTGAGEAGVDHIVDGLACRVVKGTHSGKGGTVQDRQTSKSGHVTITVRQANGVCFKTLARNVVPA